MELGDWFQDSTQELLTTLLGIAGIVGTGCVARMGLLATIRTAREARTAEARREVLPDASMLREWIEYGMAEQLEREGDDVAGIHFPAPRIASPGQAISTAHEIADLFPNARVRKAARELGEMMSAKYVRIDGDRLGQPDSDDLYAWLQSTEELIELIHVSRIDTSSR
ncbi:MAG: hypothetical protein Q8P38_04805 [Candidatus Nanopelagicales bacterium]|nr:hypothetical protein [Candidatus Nanopelagicales bacterium]